MVPGCLNTFSMDPVARNGNAVVLLARKAVLNIESSSARLSLCDLCYMIIRSIGMPDNGYWKA